MRLTVHAFLSLDGVMQGPGGPEEDRSGGFAAGGWVVPYVDDDFGAIVDSWFQRTGEFLLGRTTYTMMAAFWSQVTDPSDHVAAKLNTLPKHVVTSSADDLGWASTTQLAGDPIAAVAALKAREGGELQVHGSAQLATSLLVAGLVDELRLLTFPVVVGSGKRLFGPQAAPTGYEAVAHRTTSRGLTYLELVPGAFATGVVEVEDGAEVLRQA